MIDKAKQQNQINWVIFKKMIKITKTVTAELTLQKNNVKALQHVMKLQNKKSKKINNKQVKYDCFLNDFILFKHAIKSNENVIKLITLQFDHLYQIFQWKIKTRYTQEMAKKKIKIKKIIKQQTSEKINININTLLYLYNTSSASSIKSTTSKTA